MQKILDPQKKQLSWFADVIWWASVCRSHTAGRAVEELESTCGGYNSYPMRDHRGPDPALHVVQGRCTHRGSAPR